MVIPFIQMNPKVLYKVFANWLYKLCIIYIPKALLDLGKGMTDI